VKDATAIVSLGRVVTRCPTNLEPEPDEPTRIERRFVRCVIRPKVPARYLCANPLVPIEVASSAKASTLSILRKTISDSNSFQSVVGFCPLQFSVGRIARIATGLSSGRLPMAFNLNATRGPLALRSRISAVTRNPDHLDVLVTLKIVRRTF
jgi:hypothetical protein